MAAVRAIKRDDESFYWCIEIREGKDRRETITISTLTGKATIGGSVRVGTIRSNRLCRTNLVTRLRISRYIERLSIINIPDLTGHADG